MGKMDWGLEDVYSENLSWLEENSVCNFKLVAGMLGVAVRVKLAGLCGEDAKAKGGVRFYISDNLLAFPLSPLNPSTALQLFRVYQHTAAGAATCSSMYPFILYSSLEIPNLTLYEFQFPSCEMGVYCFCLCRSKINVYCKLAKCYLFMESAFISQKSVNTMRKKTKWFVHSIMSHSLFLIQIILTENILTRCLVMQSFNYYMPMKSEMLNIFNTSLIRCLEFNTNYCDVLLNVTTFWRLLHF